MTATFESSIFEGIADGLLVLERESYSVIAVNDRFCEMVGCADEHIVGRSVMEFTPPDEPHANVPPLGREFDESGVGAPFDWELRTTDGSVAVSVNPSSIEFEGEPAILWSVRERSASDSTARERDDGVWKHREFFDAFFSELPVHLYVKDSEGRHVWVSSHLVETYTGDPDDIIGKTDYDLVDLGATNYDDAEQAHADDRRVLETGETVIDKEEYNEALDRYFLTSKVPWRNDEGDIVGLVGVSRDITARKRYNQQLQEYRRRLEGAMFAADLAWWEMDIETGEVLFHEKKADLLGYSVADFDTYEDFVALVHPEDTERVMQQMRDHLEGDAPMYDAEYRIQTASGEYKWFHDMGGVTTTDQDGRPVKVTGIVIDVTQKKRDEERIRRQKEELAVLNRLIRHDIHNYLAIISGWTDLLLEDVPEDLRASVERVARTTTHAIDLTDDVSELIQALEGDPSLESLSLRVVLSESVSRARDTHPHAEFAVLDNLTSARVQANAMLSSVFDNLFSNAVHHNDKETPRIEVSCSDRGDSVVVHVVDNGPGISRAERADLFDHGAKGESSGGTGLGLFLVKTLVEAYGGAIWVSDNEPAGTAFHVSLRKADSE